LQVLESFNPKTKHINDAWVGTSPVGEDDYQEQRIWQQLTWSTQLRPVMFSSRTRLEQRFLETGGDTGWRFGSFLNCRIRFRLKPISS